MKKWLPTFWDADFINSELFGVSRARSKIVLEKPIAVGFSILDISKVLMFDFHYNKMKPKYGDKIKLLFTDTDSLAYEIQTDDLDKDMKIDSDLYDFSNYPPDHPLYSTKNNKVCGIFKNVAKGQPIEAWVNLRSKMYAYKIRDLEIKKANGIKTHVVKNEVSFQDYYNSLFGKEKNIRSFKHQLYSVTVFPKSDLFQQTIKDTCWTISTH